jgi:hypothetical protein
MKLLRKNLSILILSSLFSLVGCGEKKPILITVEGSITVKGEPMKSAIINLTGPTRYNGTVKDGKYTIPDVAPGTYKVSFLESPGQGSGSSDKGIVKGGNQSIPKLDPTVRKAKDVEITVAPDQKTPIDIKID